MQRHTLGAVTMAVVVTTMFGADVTTSQAETEPAKCMAVMPMTVEGFAGGAGDVGASARDLLVSVLNGPSIPVVALNARLAIHATAEAGEKGCERMLLATLTRRRGSGGSAIGRVVGQAGQTAAWHLPGGSVGTAVARSAIGAGGQLASELASGTRARDEMRLEYRLTTLDGQTLLKPTTDHQRASADGEDLLSPLLQRAAESIAAVVIGQ